MVVAAIPRAQIAQIVALEAAERPVERCREAKPVAAAWQLARAYELAAATAETGATAASAVTVKAQEPALPVARGKLVEWHCCVHWQFCWDPLTAEPKPQHSSSSAIKLHSHANVAYEQRSRSQIR